MPGINFCLSKVNQKSFIEKSKNISINFQQLEHIENKIINKNENYLLSVFRYDEYPITKVETEKYLILIEGKVYNLSQNKFEQEIINLFDNLSSFNHLKEILHNWLKTLDADIFIFFHNKINNQVMLFNDVLGRLPVYYYEDNQNLIVSRNSRFIRELIDSKKFNQTGLAQSLLFGYALGNSTIFENISRFKPGTIIYYEINKNNSAKITEFQRNYELKHNDNSDKKVLKNLTDLFVEGCKNRGTANKNVLSLSGGLDSRLVAAGLARANTHFSSVTLYDPWKDGKEIGHLETTIAEEIADLCNSECETLSIEPATGKVFIELLNIKDGNNHLGVAYLINYLRKVKESFGSDITFFTGDGGDKSVKYQLPVKNITNYDSLIEYILKIHNIFPINQVAKLTRVNSDELRNEIEKVVKSYPEKDFNFKYVHFVFQERVNNWLFEGEDRNRNYFWSVTPFYSTQFFDYSMKTKDKLKIRNKLYREMLLLLDPAVLNVKYANIKWPINSTKAKLYSFLKDKYNTLPYNSRNFIRSILKKEKDISQQHFNLKNRIIEQVKNTKEIGEILDSREIEKIQTVSPDQLKMLFNITALIEYFYSDKSILEKSIDKEFSFR